MHLTLRAIWTGKIRIYPLYTTYAYFRLRSCKELKCYKDSAFRFSAIDKKKLNPPRYCLTSELKRFQKEFSVKKRQKVSSLSPQAIRSRTFYLICQYWLISVCERLSCPISKANSKQRPAALHANKLSTLLFSFRRQFLVQTITNKQT